LDAKVTATNLRKIMPKDHKTTPFKGKRVQDMQGWNLELRPAPLAGKHGDTKASNPPSLDV